MPQQLVLKIAIEQNNKPAIPKITSLVINAWLIIITPNTSQSILNKFHLANNNDFIQSLIFYF